MHGLPRCLNYWPNNDLNKRRIIETLTSRWIGVQIIKCSSVKSFLLGIKSLEIIKAELGLENDVIKGLEGGAPGQVIIPPLPFPHQKHLSFKPGYFHWQSRWGCAVTYGRTGSQLYILIPHWPAALQQCLQSSSAQAAHDCALASEAVTEFVKSTTWNSFEPSCYPHLHFTMIIVSNDDSSSSDTKKWAADVKASGPLSPVPSVCLMFWCFDVAFGFLNSVWTAQSTPFVSW